MLNFDYYSPTKFVFGEHAEEQTGELTAPLTGSRRILIVYGSSRIEEDGLLARIEASLQADGISWVKLSGVKPNPEIGLVREGVSLVRREGVDFILAVGGGSVLDTGKAIAVEDIPEFFVELGKIISSENTIYKKWITENQDKLDSLIEKYTA